MFDGVNKALATTGRRGAMVGLAGAVALGAVGVAEANDWKRHHHHGPPGYVVVPPGHVRHVAAASAPVVYAAPVVVYQQPVVYVPVHYAPAYPTNDPPVGSLSLGLTVPLR
jgi:hypothetical protein